MKIKEFLFIILCLLEKGWVGICKFEGFGGSKISEVGARFLAKGNLFMGALEKAAAKTQWLGKP